jgi:gas vesicle protein
VEGTLAEIPGLRRGSSTLTLLSWFAAGAAVGSAVMYLLDPEQGRARRTKIQERGAAWKNEATRAASEKSRTWKEGAQSLWSKVSGALPGEHEALADNRDTKAESYLH